MISFSKSKESSRIKAKSHVSREISQITFHFNVPISQFGNYGTYFRGFSCLLLFNSAHYHSLQSTVGGASKIKLKKADKKRRVTFRRVIIFYLFLKASIADLTTLVQNSKGGGDIDGDDSCADPLQEFKKGFCGLLVVSPLFSNILG